MWPEMARNLPKTGFLLHPTIIDHRELVPYGRGGCVCLSGPLRPEFPKPRMAGTPKGTRRSATNCGGTILMLFLKQRGASLLSQPPDRGNPSGSGTACGSLEGHLDRFRIHFCHNPRHNYTTNLHSRLGCPR